MSDLDFKTASRDGYGIDWPITYRELAPYYDRVEKFLGVTGNYEKIPHLPDGQFSGKLDLNPMERKFKSAIEDRWKGILVTSPRLIGHHGDILPLPLSAALNTGLLTILENAVVSHILTDTTCKSATGAAYVDRVTMQKHRAFGKVVLLCGSTIESVRILLNSTSDRHPGGLGNSNGLLGCYLIDHCVSLLVGPVRQSSDRYDYSTGHGIYIPRFQNLDIPNRNFHRGYAIQGSINRNGPMWYLMAFGEMLPRYENRVTLDRKKKDAWKIPVCRIYCTPSENEYKMIADQRAMMKAMADTASLETGRVGCGRLKWMFYQFWAPWSWRRLASVPGTAIHEAGGARMGNSPDESVLDCYNRCWDVDNLYVTDGSSFPSSGCQHTTLTIMALTVRACAHILGNLTIYPLKSSFSRVHHTAGGENE
jgi:choline dehydrogenase-like flavoprotein